MSVSTVNLGAASVTIDLNPDEFVICVFTNAQDGDDDDGDDGAATPPPTGTGGGADTGDGDTAGGPPTALPTTGSAGLANQDAGGLSLFVVGLLAGAAVVVAISGMGAGAAALRRKR